MANIKKARNEAELASLPIGGQTPPMKLLKTPAQRHAWLTKHRGWQVAATFPGGARYHCPTGQKGLFSLDEAFGIEMSKPEPTREMLTDPQNPDPWGPNPEDMQSMDRKGRMGRRGRGRTRPAAVTN